MNKNTLRIVNLSMLIGLNIILSRHLAIRTPVVKVSFTFVTIAVAAILYGPLYAGFMAAIADFIGAMLFPIGDYFIGFTITAFLVGMVYGIFLNKRYKMPFKAELGAVYAGIITEVFLHLGLNTYWISILNGKAYMALLPLRTTKTLIMIPIIIIGIKMIELLIEKTKLEKMFV